MLSAISCLPDEVSVTMPLASGVKNATNLVLFKAGFSEDRAGFSVQSQRESVSLFGM